VGNVIVGSELAVVNMIVGYAFTMGGAFTVPRAIVHGAFAVGLAWVMGAVNVVQTPYNAVQAITNALMAANLVGPVVIAIATLAAGFVLAYNTLKPFHDAVNTAFVLLHGDVAHARPRRSVPLVSCHRGAGTAIRRPWNSDDSGQDDSHLRAHRRAQPDRRPGPGRARAGVPQLCNGLLDHIGARPPGAVGPRLT
jgi:hypothetical protein